MERAATPSAPTPSRGCSTPTSGSSSSDGLAQRIRALDAFVADVYAERRCVSDGVVPAHVLDATPYLEQDLTGSAPVAGAWISVAGFDVVRDEDGTLLVLEDNVRTPSGMAYAMAVSEAVSEVLGVEPSSGLDECASALRRCLEATNPEGEGALVLLTDGEENSAYYEHRRLADEAGLELVEPDGLRRDGDGLRLADGTPVRAVYRRTEQDGLRAVATPASTWRACCSSRGAPVGWAW